MSQKLGNILIYASLWNVLLITKAVQAKYTVKHILIECTDLAHIRKTFYSANNMKELFQNTEINNVISFLKTMKLYTKI